MPEAPASDTDGHATDDEIAFVKIHPAIGVARVGNSADEWFYGPEVPDPPPAPPGFHKDGHGAVKRQAARFRVYGYDASGRVVREITDGPGTTVSWRVHLANKKAAWYRFQLALDIPEGQRLAPDQYGRRNAAESDRDSLVIDPGSRGISGAGKGPVPFDSGKIKNVPVYLGELRTDEHGRLVVLGGRGVSDSFRTPKAPLTDFANNDGWYDDTSDGPVTAEVTINGRTYQATGAWVVVAPPNYAPDLKGIRTLYDLLYDLYVRIGWLPGPGVPSYPTDIEPILRRFCELQWVNRGFAAGFGFDAPDDFLSPALRRRLATPPGVDLARVATDPVTGVTNPEAGMTVPDSGAVKALAGDPDAGARQRVYLAMRDYPRDGRSPAPWPWIYGDAMTSVPKSDRQHLVLTPLQDAMLRSWAAGAFTAEPRHPPYRHLDEVPVAEQPAVLDRAALDYCLADAFHPGCEVTWPIRHATLYSEPFRIRHRPPGAPDPDYGPRLTPDVALGPNGPLHEQGPGDLTRWMAVPWQTDTVSCRSGYERLAGLGPHYSPYLPTFWPARVPNDVLTAADFAVVNDPDLPYEERRRAFEERANWLRHMTNERPTKYERMVAGWHRLGIIEGRDYTVGDQAFPDRVYVESPPDFPDGVPHHADRVIVHEPLLGHPAVDGRTREEIRRQVLAEVRRRTGYAAEEISVEYEEKIDPYREYR